MKGIGWWWAIFTEFSEQMEENVWRDQGKEYMLMSSGVSGTYESLVFLTPEPTSTSCHWNSSACRTRYYVGTVYHMHFIGSLKMMKCQGVKIIRNFCFSCVNIQDKEISVSPHKRKIIEILKSCSFGPAVFKYNGKKRTWNDYSIFIYFIVQVTTRSNLVLPITKHLFLFNPCNNIKW